MKVVWVKRESVPRTRGKIVDSIITEGEYPDVAALPGLDDAVSLSAHKPDQLYSVFDRVFELDAHGRPMKCTMFLRERR